MNPMRWLRNWWRRSYENPNVSLNDPDAWDDMFGSTKTSSGEKVNRTTAFRVGAFFRGVSLIADTVAKLPLIVYRIEDDARDRDRLHPVYPLLRRKANRSQTAFVFKQILTANAVTQGNGYAYIDRHTSGPDAGRARELLWLDPDRTRVIRENGELKYLVSIGGDFDNQMAEIRKVDPSSILHIRGLGYNGLVGYSVIQLAAEELGLCLASTKFSSTFFANAATPRVVIEVDGQLSDTAFERLKKSWQQLKTGLDNAHKTAILEEGAKAHALSISTKDAQLLESREFDLVTIANWLKVPPHKLGAKGRDSYASLEQANQEFLDDAVDNWLCAWEYECWDKLLTEDEKTEETHDIEFVRQALLRANLAQRASYYRQALAGLPWMSRNEIRRLENLNPVEDGDEIIDPLNMGKGGGNNTPDGGGQRETSEVAKDFGSLGIDTKRNELRKTHQRLVSATVRRMARRLCVHARKNARHGQQVAAWLESRMSTEHRPTLDEALGELQPLLRSDGPRSFADWLLDSFRREIHCLIDQPGDIESLIAAAEAALTEKLALAAAEFCH